MIEKKDPLPMISFESPHGGPIRVRPDFLLAAIGPRPDSDHPNSRLYVVSNDQRFIQIPIAGNGKNMPLPLVSFGDLSINPAFVTAIAPSIHKKGERLTTVYLHSCGGHTFLFTQSVEEVERRLRAALEKQGVMP